MTATAVSCYVATEETKLKMRLSFRNHTLMIIIKMKHTPPVLISSLQLDAILVRMRLFLQFSLKTPKICKNITNSTVFITCVDSSTLSDVYIVICKTFAETLRGDVHQK